MMKLIAPGGNRIRQPTHSLALWVDYTRHLQSETAALQGGGAVLAATKDLSLELGLSASPISFFCVGLGPFERLFISLPLLL